MIISDYNLIIMIICDGYCEPWYLMLITTNRVKGVNKWLDV